MSLLINQGIHSSMLTALPGIPMHPARPVSLPLRACKTAVRMCSCSQELIDPTTETHAGRSVPFLTTIRQLRKYAQSSPRGRSPAGSCRWLWSQRRCRIARPGRSQGELGSCSLWLQRKRRHGFETNFIELWIRDYCSYTEIWVTLYHVRHNFM